MGRNAIGMILTQFCSSNYLLSFLFLNNLQWMGFGPEEMKIPDKFEMPVSSFSEYGGHASICIRYDSKTSDRYYKPGDISPPGNNIAYLQVGVPSYRISQMMRTGGNIIDAYGIVNVISPSGFPMRGIVGINPDPIMFIALNCKNVQETREFYEQLGFIEQVSKYISIEIKIIVVFGKTFSSNHSFILFFSSSYFNTYYL